MSKNEYTFHARKRNTFTAPDALTWSAASRAFAIVAYGDPIVPSPVASLPVGETYTSALKAMAVIKHTHRPDNE